MLKQRVLFMGVLIFSVVTISSCSHSINNFKSLEITNKEIQTKSKGILSLSETIFENTPLLDICYKSYENDEVVVKTEKKVNYYSKDKQKKIKKSLQSILHTINLNKNLNMWIIVEPLRDTAIINMLRDIKSNHTFIFNKENNIFKKVGAVAISINNNPQMIQWVINNWGNQWFTIFVSSLNSIDTITHMSNLAHVTIDNKGDTTYIFRYYNPIIFSSWLEGLIKEKNYTQALTPFTEILTEGNFPHVLKSFEIESNMKVKEYDLRKSITYSNLKNKNIKNMFLKKTWAMKAYEYASLSKASINAFKIKLCKTLLRDYDLLDIYTLEEVYNIISTEVARAVKYGIERKYLLAHFVNIYFEYPEFWKKNQNMIQETIKKTKMDEVDRMEIILKAVSKFNEESKI